MVWFVLGIVLLALNLWIGIDDVKKGLSTKRTAFTWFVVGFLSWDVLHQLLGLASA